MSSRMHAGDWISVALGLWLIASPWVLGFSEHGAALWNAILFGVAIVALEFIDVYYPDPWPERASLLLGLWVAISPLMLGFAAVTPAAWSTALTGALVVVLAAWTAWSELHKPTVASH
jgi:hypothetical protein